MGGAQENKGEIDGFAKDAEQLARKSASQTAAGGSCVFLSPKKCGEKSAFFESCWVTHRPVLSIFAFIFVTKKDPAADGKKWLLQSTLFRAFSMGCVHLKSKAEEMVSWLELTFMLRSRFINVLFWCREVDLYRHPSSSHPPPS